MLKRLAIVAVLQIALGSNLSAMAFAQLAPSASEINRDVTAALRELYSHNEAAKALGAKAKAVLVFPDIKKAGLHCRCAVRLRSAPIGYQDGRLL
jgi:lipid-binding SYLF domain-containing protein